MFKFRPTITTLEQRENPSGPELIYPIGPAPVGPIAPVVAPTPPPPTVTPIIGVDPITGIKW